MNDAEFRVHTYCQNSTSTLATKLETNRRVLLGVGIGTNYDILPWLVFRLRSSASFLPQHLPLHRISSQILSDQLPHDAYR